MNSRFFHFTGVGPIRYQLDIIDELYEEEIIDDNNLEIIQNEYSIYHDKDDDLKR